MAERLAHVGYWERDLVADRITWSEEIGRICGRPSANLVFSQAELREMIHPDDRQLQEDKLAQAMRGCGIYDVEYRIVRPDGEVRWVHVRDEVVADPSGRPVRMFGTVQDVTERKRAEEALRESERRLNEAGSIAHLGYWERDLETGIGIWSGELCRISGLSPQTSTVTIAQWQNLIHPEDRQRVMLAFAEAEATMQPFDVEYRILRPDGAVRFIHSRGEVIRDGHGRPRRRFGIAQDVTERKHAEEALREARDRLRQLSRRLLKVEEEKRRHLARELHDEFGQLLATITVHVHAAKGLAGEAAQTSLDECLTLLQSAGEQVRSLALELRPTMLETSGLDAALRWLAEQHHERTGIAVEIAGYANGVSGELAIACFRVVQEALTNVVRHAQAQHAWIELSKSESALELVVRDDGVGFDVTATRERAAGGARLGLLGMSERVQVLGGSLELDSQPGRGTSIRASFPLDVSAAERAEPKE
jgi:two-component system sensor histidine kinase UhpB